jgi:predicted ATPase/Tfp pilus assembly protein PilF/transcriptional regulator with XRE-family HTH domain
MGAMQENESSKKYPPNHLLREARERRQWTHKEVAELIGLPDSHTVGRWERGEAFPRSHYRRELCRVFGMSAEELGLDSGRQKKKETPLASPAEDTQKSEPLWKVPVVLTSFIGREQEVTEVCTLLRSEGVRIVTLLGPGGIGKTRLSIKIAEEMRAGFADGVCFVALATVSDPDLVITTIANSLGIQESGAMLLADLVKVRLQEKHLLLLLDNFEQVAAGASVVEELLAACPDVKAVVTSRSVLQLPGEHLFQVSPLKLPDVKRLSNTQQLPNLEALGELSAVALFVQRARTVQRDFQITAANAQAVAECCIQLDGLPLAIELAAARIRLFTPQTLLAKLAQGLHILKSEMTFLPERQRTLNNAIKWSYDLLNEQERWLFRQLAVFRGYWTLETVAQVLGNRLPCTFDIDDVASSLLDKSLIQRGNDEDVEARFSMLETIREFGLSCLRVDGEMEESGNAHANYYLDYMERAAPHLRGALQREWLTQVEREQENLRAALEWFITRKETDAALRLCDSYGKFCGLSGYWSEEQRWFTLVFALPGEPSMMRARVLRRAGHLAYRLRDLEKARAWYEESMRLSRELDDKYNLAGVLGGLAWTLVRQHDTTISALSLLQEGVEMARASGERWSLANALESLGRFMYRQGLFEQAHQLFTESVTLMRMVGDKESLARFLYSFVSLELSRGNMAQAAALAQESFDLAQELGTVPLKAAVLDNLGIVALFQGNYEQARDFFTQRITFARDLGDFPAAAKNQVRLGEVTLAQDDPERAESLVQESLQFFREHHGSPDDIALALNISGAIGQTQGVLGEARARYKEALLLDKDGGDQKNVGKHLIGLAQVALAQGQLEESTGILSFATSLINPDIDLHPVQREHYSHAIEQLRTQLGNDRFDEIWSRGKAMTLDHVLLELG